LKRRLSLKVFNAQKDLPLSTRGARSLVGAVLSVEKAPHLEASLYFVSQKKIEELHEEFFGDPSPTDCISFPIDQEHLGEIFVCPKTALQYVERRGGDVYDEVSLYLIHGILHCLGYDDLEPKAKRIMRKKEKSCMAHIKNLSISLRGR
jgi:probable rRNA maturation factor